MLAYTYIEQGKFELREKPIPEIQDSWDAIVRVTLGSICSSDLHIKHGSVPRAVSGITVGHEMVGVVEKVGADVTAVKPGDRVTVNVETFCGECFFCRRGYVNNCTDPNGGWALGCRIDGGQAEYVRVPYADRGLNRIPDTVSDEQALLVGDVLATGFWAARISEVSEEDTVLIIGAGPTGICTLLCVFCPLFTTTTVKRGRFGKRSGNFFVFPVCSLQQSGGVVCQRFLKMGAKKAVNLFKIYCLSAAVMGGGIKLSAVFQMEFICNRFLSAFQFLFCNLP